MVKRANNKKKFKKGTQTWDVKNDIANRVEKELLLLELENNKTGGLTEDIDITININILYKPKAK